jgi:Helix-turn-helix
LSAPGQDRTQQRHVELADALDMALLVVLDKLTPTERLTFVLQLGLGQKQIAANMGVSVARVSQIEHGEVTSFEVIARYVEALGGRLDLVADFGDRTVRLPVSDTESAT